MSRRTKFSFAEERAPCGVAGGLTWEYGRHSGGRRPVPALDDVLIARPRDHMLIMWEPLPTKAPGPHLTRPWCCYINTVIFYVGPAHVTRPPGWYRSRDGTLRKSEVGTFYEWDRVEHRFAWDDLLAYDGWLFKMGGGSVLWSGRRWWMRHWARRERNDDGPIRAPRANLVSTQAVGP